MSSLSKARASRTGRVPEKLQPIAQEQEHIQKPASEKPAGAQGIQRRVKSAATELRRSGVASALLSGTVRFRMGRSAGEDPRRSALGAATVAAAHWAAVRSRLALSREIRNAREAAVIAQYLPISLPAFGDFAIDGDTARVIVHEMSRWPDTTVEFGSGLSTVLAAKLLKERGAGRLISIDHDERYAEATQTMLREAELQDRVTVITAPLVSYDVGGRHVRWYDRSVLAEVLEAEIDLVIVDGPPQVNAFARLPALDLCYDRLAPGAVVLLDDGRRRDEGRVARRWAQEYRELELFWIDTEKGLWRLVRSGERTTGRSEALHALARALNPRPSGFGLLPVRRR